MALGVRNDMRYAIFLSLPLYAIDQITKWLALQQITSDAPRIIIPEFFALVFVTNTGAAFGSFRNNNFFFIALSCAALVFILVMLLRHRPPDAWRSVSLALLLAGVMGNLTDRLWHGHVIDFLLFDLHVPLAHPWPAFNVADACICLAVFCFIIHSLKQGRSSAEAASNAEL